MCMGCLVGLRAQLADDVFQCPDLGFQGLALNGGVVAGWHPEHAENAHRGRVAQGMVDGVVKCPHDLCFLMPRYAACLGAQLLKVIAQLYCGGEVGGDMQSAPCLGGIGRRFAAKL